MEYQMKFAHLLPKKGAYTFEDCDALVDLALKKGMKIRGHTLVWHRDVPDWVNGVKSKAELLSIMKNYIKTVVGRYRGKIYAWDVVNEAVSDDGLSGLYRKTKWMEVIGEEYIEKAFRWAHEADPKAILFYNDYSTEDPNKRSRIVTMIKSLQSKGVPIHGMGMQAHYQYTWPPIR